MPVIAILIILAASLIVGAIVFIRGRNSTIRTIIEGLNKTRAVNSADFEFDYWFYDSEHGNRYPVNYQGTFEVDRIQKKISCCFWDEEYNETFLVWDNDILMQYDGVFPNYTPLDEEEKSIYDAILELLNKKIAWDRVIYLSNGAAEVKAEALDDLVTNFESVLAKKENLEKAVYTSVIESETGQIYVFDVNVYEFLRLFEQEIKEVFYSDSESLKWFQDLMEMYRQNRGILLDTCRVKVSLDENGYIGLLSLICICNNSDQYSWDICLSDINETAVVLPPECL